MEWKAPENGNRFVELVLTAVQKVQAYP